MSQPAENRSTRVQFNESHADALMRIGVLSEGERSITPTELLVRAKTEKKYDEVIEWISNELANSTMIDLQLADFSLIRVEELLTTFTEDHLSEIMLELGNVQNSYDRITQQAPLLKNSYDLLIEERNRDESLPAATQSKKYYIDKVPRDMEMTTDLMNDISERLDRIIDTLSSMGS